MPGVDFDRVRAEVTIEQVLDLLGFAPTRRSGLQWYGRCPLRACGLQHRRSLSVNVALGRYHCHRCHSQGNVRELWVAATSLPLYQAAVDPCQRLGRDVAWLRRC